MKSDLRSEPLRLAQILSSLLKLGSRIIILSVLFVEIATVVVPAQTASHTSQNSQSPDKNGHAAANSEEMAELPVVESFDIAELVRQCNLKGTAMHRSIFEYTYTLKKVRATLNDQGKVKDESVELFEAYPVRGEHVLIKLRSNGEPMPPWRVRIDRKLAGERLMEAERAREKSSEPTEPKPQGYISAGIIGNAQSKGNGRSKRVRISIDLSEFLRACEFFSPRRERLDGRDTIVLRFRPRAGISLSENKKYISELVGVVWIDAADKIVVRLEGWPATESADGKDDSHLMPDPNAALIYQQTRVEAGKWFPSLIRMNPASDLSLFDGLGWDVSFEFLDYKQFKVEVEDPRLKNPPDGK